LPEQVHRVALERPERRKICDQPGGDDLVQLQGTAEVLEPVLAEIAQTDLLDRLTGQDPLRRLADDHLAAVRRRADPRSAVHVHPDVILTRDPRLARVCSPILTRTATPPGH
jgi:hypothetical protein